MIARILLYCIALISGLSLTIRGQAQPNVILILTDDLGYGELGTYGNNQVKTPNLDQLAKDGVRLTRAYSNSTVCSPSRASILFGDYPDMLGVPGVIRADDNNTWGNLIEGKVSLPDKFTALGYTTAMFGKWHLGYASPDLPLDRGFQYFKGFLGDMMDDYYTHLREGKNWMRENRTEIFPEGHATEIFTQWSIEYIRSADKSDKPFFMYLAYNAPHDPVQPPDNIFQQVKADYPSLSPKRQKMIALIEHLDSNIGELINELKRQGIYENTIILFSSDNGGALSHGANNGPLKGGKGEMFEGGIRIPCTVTWAGKVPAGELNNPFLLMDLYDLLPDMATNQDKYFDLSHYISTHKRELMIWVRREGHRYGGRVYYAISNGEYKLLQNNPFEPLVLYKLSDDGSESMVSAPEIEAKLKELLTKHVQNSGKIPWQ